MHSLRNLNPAGRFTFFRALLLALLLLLAQAGALIHGVGHILDQGHGDEPACEHCLAYAAIGAGMASAPLAWSAPTHFIPHDAPVPVAPPTQALLSYQSRAPPRPNC